MARRAFAVPMAVLCLGVGLPALAQDLDDDEEIDRLRPGGYFVLTGLHAWSSFNGVFTSATDNSAGVGTRIGYRLDEIWAVEGMYEWVAGFDARAPNGSRLATTTFNSWTVNGRAYLPRRVGQLEIPDAVQPYLLGGFGITYVANVVQSPGSSTYDTGPVLRGGIGLELYGYGSENLALTSELSYQAGMVDAKGWNYLAVNAGIMWRW